MPRFRCIFRGAFSANASVVLSLTLSLLLTSGAAFAQVRFAPDQCEAALRIADEIRQQYDISPRLAASFENFRRSNCDVETLFGRDTAVDVKAFLEFRFRFELWKTCNDNPLNRVCQ